MHRYNKKGRLESREIVLGSLCNCTFLSLYLGFPSRQPRICIVMLWLSWLNRMMSASSSSSSPSSISYSFSSSHPSWPQQFPPRDYRLHHHHHPLWERSEYSHMKKQKRLSVIRPSSGYPEHGHPCPRLWIYSAYLFKNRGHSFITLNQILVVQILVLVVFFVLHGRLYAVEMSLYSPLVLGFFGIYFPVSVNHSKYDGFESPSHFFAYTG